MKCHQLPKKALKLINKKKRIKGDKEVNATYNTNTRVLEVLTEIDKYEFEIRFEMNLWEIFSSSSKISFNLISSRIEDSKSINP